ncbi:MAG: M6 family metalloprotease domain-containing protein, partial [Calditrichia bacterium]|nr:M6 family metalloprotease domain-containing protein [Calditrichia bacterium]
MNLQNIVIENLNRDEILKLIPRNLFFILKIRLFIPIWLFVVSLALADAPHPRVLEMMKNGNIETPYYLENLDELRARGINTPATLPDGRRVPGPPRNTEVNYSAIAILVDFSDNVSQVNASFFDNLMYGTGNGTVRHYYDEVTYGNLTVVTLNLPSSMGWLRAPQTYAYYVNNNNGFGSYPQNAQKLAEDVIALANPLVDFSQYDNDGDGYVDALFIIHSGPGAEFTGSNNDIWSHKWGTFSPQLVDGVYAYVYSMEPEYWQNPGDMTCGVYAHEMGHAVFGLPDVYDRDGSSRGLGRWSLMAGGSWNGSLGNSPAHPDAWNRVQMGYVTPHNITTDTTGYSLPDIQNNQSMVRLWTHGNPGNQYFLVENRQRLGYDAALPQAGMCIYHVDESVNTQNDREWYPGYTNSGHYLVALEQADGLWQLEMNSNSGNSGDPFPGSGNSRTFDDNSTPDSRNYNFQYTQVAVRNISNSALIMQADFEVGIPQIAPDIEISPTSFSFTVEENDTSSDMLLISNTGNGDLLWTITELNDVSSTPQSSPIDASWLSENPTSGTVTPGGNQNVILLVNAAGLTVGAYSCNLSIDSNDPDENPLIVPVNLTVVLPNQSPVTQNDVAETDEDLDVSVDVLANDSDPDGNLDVSSVTI